MGDAAAGREIAWRARAGPLAAEVAGHGARLTFVHGFTQTRASWRPVASSFTQHHQVMLVDAPGHGGSSAVRADLHHGADLLATTAASGTYVGYSMGGRLCLHLALAYPHLVERLVLISATAGISDDAARAARRARDDRLAREIERDGVEVFLRRWLDQPLFSTLPAAATQMDERAGNTASGLASSLRLAGTGAQLPLWDRLCELSMPLLVLAGEHDPAFCALGQQIAEMAAGPSTFALVHDAGHAAHLEQPAQVMARIEGFLAAHR